MQAWQDFIQGQVKEIGEEAANKWLRSLKVLHFDACNLYLEAKDSFSVLWFEEHIRPKTLKLCNNNGRRIKIHLTAPQDGLPKEPKKAAKKVFKPPFHLAEDSLDPLATWEGFIPAGNELLYQFLEKLEPGNFNPIFIHGAKGSGKTHLLMALCQRLKAAGLQVFFVRAQTFTDHLVGAIKNGSMQEFRQAYRKLDALLIDDIHIFSDRMATQEEFFHTFNTLHLLKKQMIFTSNLSPMQLERIEPRLVSRFEWGISFHLQKLESAHFPAMLKARAETLKFSLAEDLLEFLLSHFKSCHTLLQALHALTLRTKNSSLSASAAALLLTDLIEKEKEAILTPEKIIRSVAAVYGIKTEDILGKSQSHECTLPRQIAMYLCREELKLPFLKIGALFSRDHSTVMTSVKQIENKKKAQESNFCASLTEILSLIRS